MTDGELDRAFDYPYDVPPRSFLFVPGRGVSELDAASASELVQGRRAVLAVGSNAAPSQLARKFGEDDGVIPVVRADLHDHDVVYAARFAPYGAVPATMLESPGTTAHVHATYL